MSKSIESVIRTTDKLCITFGMKNTLSHMTKYRIIADLIESELLVTKKTKKHKKLRLAKKIYSYLE